MDKVTIMSRQFPIWVYAPLLYVAWVSLFLLLKGLAFKWIEQISAKTASCLDDILIRALNFPLTLLVFVSGALFLRAVLPTDGLGQVSKYFTPVIKIATVLAIGFFVDRCLKGLIREYSTRVEILKSSGAVVQGFTRTVILGLGSLILLDSFGVSITPVIASLGIGSLGVALGLQPTLENFFSGIQIVTDRTIQVGQLVRLDSGEEGYVEKIGWRSTWLCMLSNNRVIVPNKVLVNQRVLNYDYPAREVTFSVEVGVSYDSDLARVEKVTVEVAEEVLKAVPGGVAEFKPFVRYHTFSDSSVDLTVFLRARQFTDQLLLKHEFIKRLHERYEREEIRIPFPVRTLDLKRETLSGLRSGVKSP